MEIGIVGLPNVGKSTLFNALLKRQQAYVANFPFATIEPNVGVVPVPDGRLKQLAELVDTQKIVPATVKFVDIAGLVAGASKGEGLGNKFLARIREVDAIAHVIRGFSDENVIRAGSVNPSSDYEVVETELLLADLETANRVKESKDKALRAMGEKAVSWLEKGIAARDWQISREEAELIKQMNLLTSKPVIKVLNVDENNLCTTVFDGIVVCAKMESELAVLSEDEQAQFLSDLGIKESGLEKLIKKAFDVLGLQTFLTAGEKEVRAWTIKKGTKAAQAAGVIHGDFEKHFIKADVIYWEEFVRAGGWQKAREEGKVRMEGKDYVMREGDVVEFKVGV